MRKLFLAIAMLPGLFAFLPKPAAAAPFCIESNGVPAQCWYYDARECKTEAGKEHARCTANPNEIKVSGTGGSYCIVDSEKRPNCGFQNWQTCEDLAAKRGDTVCFQNNTKQNADPYRYDRMPLQPN